MCIYKAGNNGTLIKDRLRQRVVTHSGTGYIALFVRLDKTVSHWRSPVKRIKIFRCKSFHLTLTIFGFKESVAAVLSSGSFSRISGPWNKVSGATGFDAYIPNESKEKIIES